MNKSSLLMRINQSLIPLGNSPENTAYKAFRQKTTGLNVFGIRVPVLREILEEDIVPLLDKDEKEILLFWDSVWWQEEVHEIMSLVLYYYEKPERIVDFDEFFNFFKAWIDRIENWEHADLYAKIMHGFLLSHRENVFPLLLDWKESDNSWKNRLSLTSLFLYVRHRLADKYLSFKEVLPFYEVALGDKDMYVQKGLGWSLRECGKIYPAETREFIEKNITKLSATAFSYSTEHWKKAEKAPLKEIRRLKRLANK